MDDFEAGEGVVDHLELIHEIFLLALLRGKAPSRRLSSTLMEEKSSRFSGTREMPCMTRSSTGMPSRSWPINRICPLALAAVGRAPVAVLSVVDFPAPLGPMMATIWPGCTCRLTSCTTATVPSLRKVASIEVSVAAPVLLGELAGMQRRMIPIAGGSFTSDGVSGVILPGGSDVQTVRPDGTLDLLARYAIDLGPQGNLLVENTGIRRASVPGQVDVAAYFRGVLRFYALPGPLPWLNDRIFVSSGYRDGHTVFLDVMELL